MMMIQIQKISKVAKAAFLCSAVSLGLLSSSVLAGAPVAASSTPAKGFYVGVSAGAAAMVGEYNRNTVGSTSNKATVESNNYGILGGVFGLVGGYNFQKSAFVMGLDLSAQVDTSDKEVFNNIASDDSAVGYFARFNVKKAADFTAAFRAGFMMTPSTLVYIRLGGNYAKWEYKITPDVNMINNSPLNTAISASAKTVSSVVLNSNKSQFGFAPGMGVEVYRGKTLFRVEYAYLMGPTLKVAQDVAGWAEAIFSGTMANHSLKLNQHQFKIVVGYKF